jgi:hypothetical protein
VERRARRGAEQDGHIAREAREGTSFCVALPARRLLQPRGPTYAGTSTLGLSMPGQTSACHGGLVPGLYCWNDPPLPSKQVRGGTSVAPSYPHNRTCCYTLLSGTFLRTEYLPSQVKGGSKLIVTGRLLITGLLLQPPSKNPFRPPSSMVLGLRPPSTVNGFPSADRHPPHTIPSRFLLPEEGPL